LASVLTHAKCEQKPKEIFLISDVLADVEQFKAQLAKAGVRISRANSPSTEMPRYSVYVPDDIHILQMGDFLSYTRKNAPSSRRAKAQLFISNREMMGLVRGLVQNANVTILAGTSEVHALRLIDRRDHPTYYPDLAVTRSLAELVLKGKVVHSAAISSNSWIGLSPTLRKKYIDIGVPRDYVATHAGITYGIWRYLSASVSGASLIGSPGKMIQDANLIAQLLNHDLVLATQAVMSVMHDPNFTVDNIEKFLKLPETMTASKYVYGTGVDKLSSPTSADPREIHRSWGGVAFQTPQFGLLRAHSSIVPDHASDSRFEAERIWVGPQETRGIVVRNTPCITIHSQDTPNTQGNDFRMSGIVQSPVSDLVLANAPEIALNGTSVLAGQDIDLSHVTSLRHGGFYQDLGRSIFR